MCNKKSILINKNKTRYGTDHMKFQYKKACPIYTM